jgi:hypothetical protein
MTIRQTRKGWFQEICLGCEAKTEFRWFDTTSGSPNEFATSLEHSSCLNRFCCPGATRRFKMPVLERGSEQEILTVHKTFSCGPAACKCCCYLDMDMRANGHKLGSIKEQFYCCVPRFIIKDSNDTDLYKLHPPTCCGGMCMDCCAEGNPCCGRGCCKVPFHLFPASQQDTDNGAEPIAKIVKVPKSLSVEIFTDSEAFDVTFPNDATAVQKAIIASSAVLINAAFFEETNNGGE